MREPRSTDLALVWSPRTTRGTQTESTESGDFVTVLLLARISELSPEGGKGLPNKRLRSTRPPARRVEEHMMQAIRSTVTTAYNGMNFYKGLLILSVKRASIRCTKPLYTELQPFVEAGFNVRAWKRYLTQDSLQFGDRVTVHGGPHHGRLGVINTCWPGNAVIAAIGEDDDGEGIAPTLLEVDMRSLD